MAWCRQVAFALLAVLGLAISCQPQNEGQEPPSETIESETIEDDDAEADEGTDLGTISSDDGASDTGGEPNNEVVRMAVALAESADLEYLGGTDTLADRAAISLRHPEGGHIGANVVPRKDEESLVSMSTRGSDEASGVEIVDGLLDSNGDPAVRFECGDFIFQLTSQEQSILEDGTGRLIEASDCPDRP